MPAIPVSTSTGTAAGVPIGDGFMSKTETAGTAITRVVPARGGEWGFVTGFNYRPAATAHTLTFLTEQSRTTVATEAAAAGATITVNGLPDAFDDAVLANTDWLVVVDEFGYQLAYLISSVAGSVITVGTPAALTTKLLAGSIVYLMGTPADHANRQFLTVASADNPFYGNKDMRAATSSRTGSPILVHSDNATNAGNLKWLSYSYTYGGIA